MNLKQIQLIKNITKQLNIILKHFYFEEIEKKFEIINFPYLLNKYFSFLLFKNKNDLVSLIY